MLLFVPGRRGTSSCGWGTSNCSWGTSRHRQGLLVASNIVSSKLTRRRGVGCSCFMF
jgi:hypothetical protein